MANAPQVFSASALTELIALKGRAKISFPTADAPHFRVERAFQLSKDRYAALAFDQADQEFPTALLKYYQKASEDAQNVTVALRYEILPGLPLTKVSNSILEVLPGDIFAGTLMRYRTTRIDPSVTTDPSPTSGTVLSSAINMDTAVEGTLVETVIPDGTFPITVTGGAQVSVSTLGETANIIRTLDHNLTPDQGLYVISSEVTAFPGTDLTQRITTEFLNPPVWPVLTEKTLGSANVFGKFRLPNTFDTTITRVDPNVAPDPDALGGGVVESSLSAETKDRSIKRTTTVNGDFVVLTGHVLNDGTLGDSAEVVEQVVTDGTAPASGFYVLNSEVSTLGNGYSISRTEQMNSDTGFPVLTGKNLGDVGTIPSKFRVGIPLSITQERVAPSASPDALSSTVLESIITPDGKDRSVKRTTALASGTLSVLTGHQRNSDGQIVTVVQDVVADGTTPTLSATTIEASVDPLGNGQSVRVIGTIASVFPHAVSSIRVDDVTPRKFLTITDVSEVSTTAAGTQSLDTLGTDNIGIISSEVDQVTVDTSRKTTTTREGTLAGTVVGARADNGTWGNTASTVSVYDASTIDTGADVISSSLESIGDGKQVMESVSLPLGSWGAKVAYRAVSGGFIEQTTTTKIPANTRPSDTDAGVISERIDPENIYRSDRVVVEIVDASGNSITDPTALPSIDIPLEYDKETRVQIWRNYRLVLNSHPLPALGDAFQGGFVIDARLTPIGEAPYFSIHSIQEVEWSELPPSRIEYPTIGYEFPALFKSATGYSWNSIQQYYAGFPPPWPGDGVRAGTYQLIAHRPAVRQARRVHTFSVGSSGFSPTDFKVITPGVSSKLFQIPSNCIHAQIDVFGDQDGFSYQIEQIPASYPAQYSGNDILTVSCEERQVLGRFYERIITEISEDRSPFEFPAYFSTVAFKSTGQPDIIQQPDRAGERLFVISDSASDTQAATIHGGRSGRPIRQKVTLTGTSLAETAGKFQHIQQVHLTSPAVGNVRVQGQGVPAAGIIDFAGITDGDTYTVGPTGSEQIYTLKTTPATANDVQIDDDPDQTVINLALAINGTGTAGAAGLTPLANYFTGTLPTLDITASIDGEDSSVIHVADFTAAFTNTNTYTLSTTGPATITAFAGSADGPVFVRLAPGESDAYPPAFLNNPGLLTNNEAGASALFPALPSTPGVQSNFPLVTTSTGQESLIIYNLPANIGLVSDWLAVPQFPFSLEMALLGTPSLVIAYEVSATGSEAKGDPATAGVLAGSASMPLLGNGKVFILEASEDATTAAFVRVKISNSSSTLRRAIHVAVKYQVD